MTLEKLAQKTAELSIYLLDLSSVSHLLTVYPSHFSTMATKESPKCFHPSSHFIDMRRSQAIEVQSSQNLYMLPEEITSEDSECEYLFVSDTINTPNDKTKEALDKSYRGEDLVKYESFEDFEASFFE